MAALTSPAPAAPASPRAGEGNRRACTRSPPSRRRPRTRPSIPAALLGNRRLTFGLAEREAQASKSEQHHRLSGGLGDASNGSPRLKMHEMCIRSGTGSGSRSASLAGYLIANRRGQRRDDRGGGRQVTGPPAVNQIQREGQHAFIEFRKTGSVDGSGPPFHVATQFVKNGQFGVHAVSYLSRSLKEAASSNAR